MSGLQQEIAAFRKNQQLRIAEAGQMAALQTACHFDLAEAMRAGADARRRIVQRLERTIERERQRGIRKHWSYDLNRHIALKQALDKLRETGNAAEPPRPVSSVPHRFENKRKRRPKAPLQIIV